MINAALKYLIFDVDDTLYPKDRLWPEITARISRYMVERLGLPAHAVPQLRTQYMERYGTTGRGLSVEYHIDMEDFLAFVHDVPVSGYIKPDPTLDAALAQLAQEKVVFTNATEEHARRVLNALGVEQHFTRIFDLRFMDYFSKPNEHGYRKLLEALPARGPECLYVEDSLRNLAPAKRLGMHTALIDDGQPAPKEIVDFVVQGADEIVDVVKQIDRNW